MNSTLAHALEAHGGLENWKRHHHLSLVAVNGGVLWPMKHQADYAESPVGLSFDLDAQVARHADFVEAGLRTEVSPQRVAIFAKDGRLLEERRSPRVSFEGHTLETPWDRVQLAYFSGYAMWSYLNTPFLLAEPDFVVEDAPSWFEGKDEWKAIEVTFPERLAYHAKKQLYYFDHEGLLRRHDYDVDIAKGARGAHTMHDYAVFDGIKIAQHHVVRVPGADNVPMAEPIIVDVRLSNIAFGEVSR
jgi:hypothetical protein